jgi:hypothetical protein
MGIGMRVARWLSVAVVCAGSVLAVLPAGAAVASAKGCTGRNGPGAVNSTCITVAGSGLHVDSVEVAMNSTSPGGPVQLCEVGADLTGTLANHQPFHRHGQSRCSKVGHAYVEFPVNLDLAPQSLLCATTTFEGRTASPACEKIEP